MNVYSLKTLKKSKNDTRLTISPKSSECLKKNMCVRRASMTSGWRCDMRTRSSLSWRLSRPLQKAFSVLFSHDGPVSDWSDIMSSVTLHHKIIKMINWKMVTLYSYSSNLMGISPAHAFEHGFSEVVGRHDDVTPVVRPTPRKDGSRIVTNTSFLERPIAQVYKQLDVRQLDLRKNIHFKAVTGLWSISLNVYRRKLAKRGMTFFSL